jgi:hypothetical protein
VDGTATPPTLCSHECTALRPTLLPTSTSTPAPISPDRNVLGHAWSPQGIPAPQTATPLQARAETRVLQSPCLQPITRTRTAPLNSNTPRSRLSTPASFPAHLQNPKPSRSRLSTRSLLSFTYENARASSTQPPVPTTPLVSPRNPISSPILSRNIGTLGSEVTSSRRSLGLPNIPSGPADDSDNHSSDVSRPSTPVYFNATDVDPVNFPPIISSHPSRASQFRTICLLPSQRVSATTRHIPTLLDLHSNALTYYNISRHARRTRRSAPSAPPLRIGMRAGTLSPDQKVIMHLMEHHMLRDIFMDNPWPEDRTKFLQDAKDYAARISGIFDPEVVTEKFEDTVRPMFLLFRAYSHRKYRP